MNRRWSLHCLTAAIAVSSRPHPGGIMFGMELKFTAKLTPSGSGVLIKVPFDPNEAWGEKDVHHISGRVGPCGVRGALQRVENGGWALKLGAAWLRDSPVKAGEEAAATLWPEGPLVGTMAGDISEAVSAETSVRKYFEALPTFYRNNFVRWIEEAKRPETRARRIAEMMELLRAGRRER